MYLCWHNPQLLNHDWAVELVRRQNGKVSNSGFTALILLFYGKPEKTDFSSKGFKLLWEKEKDINVYSLKHFMQNKSDLKQKIIAAAPDATAYYE